MTDPYLKCWTTKNTRSIIPERIQIRERHIEQLVFDLTSPFLDKYRPEHHRTGINNYNSYYLEPFVLSMKDGNRSIIDGQQRLSSFC